MKTLITAALPYANGDIHIGHLLEYVQADIYTRFLKLQGEDALYICASDMHGTPVEVNAKKAGKKPEAFAEEFWKKHQKDFKSFLIEFDNYYKTHSPENKEMAEFFFLELKKKGYITRKNINAIFCTYCERSLPDRYVRGTCPHCSTAEQYGDICEQCGSALKGTDLLNPKCSLCGRSPVQKEREHYFFTLSAFTEKLTKWLQNTAVQPEVRNWVQGWLDKGLEDWCISRDAPYFGFEIPQSREETGALKYFYVWLDAPIGYISSTKQYCSQKTGKQKTDKTSHPGRQREPCHWEDYWHRGKVHHFIGKDIAYFHFLFWPAMLMAVGIPLPDLTVHGFITVNGEKMSKSRGTFFTAKDFLKLYPPEALRFFYANHLDRKVVDVDLNFNDFTALHNNVLLGNIGNFCYRVLSFAAAKYKSFPAKAGKETAGKVQAEGAPTPEVMELIKEAEEHYRQFNFKSAMKTAGKIADIGNSYFQQQQPWKDAERAKNAVHWCVNLARSLAVMLSPVLPLFSAKVSACFAQKSRQHWKDINFSWSGAVRQPERLMEKIDAAPKSERFPLRMKTGKILSVNVHPKADSLYVMQVSFTAVSGEKNQSAQESRQVVAGLKKYLSAEELQGRTAVFCVNIKPAKLRGELSEAMILVADDGENIGLLETEKTPVGSDVTVEGMAPPDEKLMLTFDEFKKLMLVVSQGRVLYNGKKLITSAEEVRVHGVKEGGRVY